MPRYRIRDNETGATLLVEGPTPPTPEVAAELFAKRKTTPAPEPSAQPDPGPLELSDRSQLPDRMAMQSVTGQDMPGMDGYVQPGAGRQALGRFVQGAAGVVAGVPEAIAITADKIGQVAPFMDEGKPLEELATYRAGRAIREAAGRLAPVDPTRPKSFFADTLPQGAGSMAGFIGGGALGRAAKAPAWAATAMLGAGTAGADAYDEALTAGGTEEQAWTSFLLNAGAGTTEAIPIAKWLSGANRASGGALRRAVREGSEEAAQEIFQSFVSNVTARDVAGYDPDRKLTEGMAEGGGAGAILGTTMSLLFRGKGQRNAERGARSAEPVASPAAPTDQRQPMPVETARGVDIAPTPPQAVFKGQQGQDIRIELGGATLDQVKEYVFRTQPSATFAGVEGTSVAPTNPTENVPAAAEPPAPSPAQSISSEVTPPIAATTGGTPTVAARAEAPAATPGPETITGSNVQPGTEMPVAANPPAPGGPAVGDTVKSDFAEGRMVFARLSNKSNKLHRAKVIRVTEDGITVRFEKSKLYQTLPPSQVQLPANVAGRKLYEAQFAGMSPEQKRQTKADSRKFDDLVRNEGWRFDWYDPRNETDTETAGQRAAAQSAFKAALNKAMQAVGADGDAVSSLDRAKALPALQKFLQERRGDVEQGQDFEAATSAGPVAINADEMVVGAVLDIDGEPTTVVDVSPDGTVTLQNGKRFGRQTLESGETIYVEKVEQPAGSAEFLPEEAAPDFTLNAPESIEEQQAREAADAAKRAEQAAKDKLAEKVVKPLTGTTGDLGQGDLLGAPTDLFAPPAPKAAKPFGSENKLVSTAQAEELRRRLREKLGGGRVNMGVDPTIFTDAVQLGVYYLEGGVRAFPEWSAKMIADLGDGIRPWLRSVYEGARSFPGANYEEEMDSSDRVRELHKAYVAGADPNLERAGGGTGEAAGAGGAGGVQPPQPGQGGGAAGPVGGQLEAFPDEPANPLGAGGDLPVDAGERGDQVLPEQRPQPGRAGAKPGGRGGRGRRGGANESRASAESQSDLGTPGSPKVAPDAPKLEAGSDLGNEQRAELQRQAEGKVRFQAADADSIAASLPMLLPPQREDVLKAERRFYIEHPTPAQGGSGEGLGDPKRGILFTNGTGTGKTFTGLGIIKRFLMQGKRNILVVAPTQTVVNSWVSEGKQLLIEITPIPDTSTSGEGVVVTTYANFRQNEALLKRDFDLVVMDECHHILSNEAGEFTAGIESFRRNANHPDAVRRKAANKVLGPIPSKENYPDTPQGKLQHRRALDGYFEAERRNKPLIDREVERLNAINTRVVFLSATPFAYHKSLQLVDGYLYSLPSDEGRSGYNTPTGFGRALVESFGYRMRYGKVTQPDQSVRVDLMEMAFNDALKKKGAVSGRIIDVPTDYSREFVIVDSELGRAIDDGFNYMGGMEAYKQVPAVYAVFRAFWDYNQKAQLLEALKMAEAVPRIREHIKLGRKVILFHTYIQAGVKVHPFKLDTYPQEVIEEALQKARLTRNDLAQQQAAFEAAHVDWVTLEMPDTGKSLARLEREFGSQARFFNGTVPKRKRAEAVVDFNKDNNGVHLIVAQLQAGKEGISLHDRTGKHQRVVMIAALPTRPTDAVQAEGRAYRIGVVTHAVYEYLALHTMMERFQFGSRINEKVSTVETLALGSQARNLRERFKDAYLNALDFAPSEQQGTGGKQADRRAETASDFEKAKAFYYGRLKKNSKTKAAEGVDYFATPEPLGLKMVEWARIRTGEHVLEPSAGHGAIGRFFPETAARTFVEPSAELRSELGVKVSGGRIVAGTFEDLDIVNKYDAIVLNPPYGQGGSTAIRHLAKAAWHHLRDGGRIVALLPEGPSANAKMEKFLADPQSKHLYVRRVFGLPTSTFERAGTSVKTQVVIIDRSDTVPLDGEGRIDFRGDEDVNELFDAIEPVESIERPMPAAEAFAKYEADLIRKYNGKTFWDLSGKLTAAELKTYGDLENAANARPSASAIPATVPVKQQATSTVPSVQGAALLEGTQTIHAIKKIPLFVAKTTRRVSDEDFATLKRQAKHDGGYWSSFAKNGAIPGFQFESARKRDEFMEKMNAMFAVQQAATDPDAVRAAAAQLNTPEAVADVLLNPAATDAQQAAAEAKADEAERRVMPQPRFSEGQKVVAGEGPFAREGTIAAFGPYRDGKHSYFVTTNLGEQVYQEDQLKPTGGIRIQTKDNSEAGFILNPADLLIAGARMLRRLGMATASKAQWTAAMLKAYGQRVANHLAGLWIRLARLQNQQANNVGPVAQGHINAVEELAGRTNIAEEEKPLYDAATLAKGNPSLATKAAPVSTQIKILGGQDLLNAKRRRDVEEATAASAVKKQSDELWQQLVQSAARANPLTQWKLPNWLVGTPRARKFKERALHIAARLNATGRDVNGNFVSTPFRQRMGSMTPKEFRRGQHQVGAQIQMQSPVTGQIETVTIGPFVSTPDGRAFYQLYRDIDATTQADLYQHYANEYPDMIWFLDMFIDPALANMRQTINGIEVPVFNRFAAAAMMADGNPNFSPLAAYTPDVLVTRSLLGSIRGALSFRAGTRSPGRKYKSGTSREGGHVRDLLSGFNIRTWQMLAEQSRRQWMQAVMQAATPIRKNQVPAGWVKVETGMEELWQAVKRLRNWSSPESRRDITKQVQDDGLEEIEESLKPTERIVQKGGRWYVAEKLFPETEARLSERGQLDEDRDYKAFFGEAASLRGRQLMLPEALVKQLVQKYRAQVEHGMLYRLGAWAVRNSTRLFLVAPTTYVANVLTNDLFTLEAATRRILSGAVGQNAQDLRFARELMVGEFWKWFPGLRGLVDRQYRDTVEQVLPDNLFADQTALADLKMRLDEDPISYLRQGEIGAAALQVIRYGNIDVRSKQRMAYAWLKAMALTNAKQAGLRGAALRTAVDRYLVNPPVADRAKAVEIAGFELLNYADTPDWLQNLANNDYSKLVLPFPRFGYHYLAKNAQRAAAVRDLLARVPAQSRADAFADLVTFLLWPAGGLGVLAAYGIRGLGDDDDEARKLVGTSRIKTLDEGGDVVSKPIDRALITSNRINLSAWARQLGLGTETENDFWLRVRNYPVIAMAGAALLAEEDARKFGPKEGAKTYLGAVFDLGTDFFSVGMAGKVPAKAMQELTSRPKDRTPLDPYSANVPLVAYITDQTLDSFVPGTRQADIAIRWLDPVQRRRTSSKTLGFEPTVWDAARVGHLTGLMDRLLAGQPGEFGPMESTLPPEGRVTGGMVQPQVYPPLQRVAELGGFNVRPVNRAAYEGALTP